MFKKLVIVTTALLTFAAYAEEAVITGEVSAKCVIHTDTPGVYGNPTPNVLSTAATDGGVQPVIRFDVVQAGYYKAVITTPIEFSSSPALTDVVNWTGSVEVSEVTDAAMSSYTTDKRTYNNTSEFDLTVPGTVWFKASSEASYGYNRAFPSGTYKAVVIAECIAL